MDLKKLNIHIIGGTGQMGSWLKKFLEAQEILPTVSDQKISGAKLIAQADIIFISVPINIAPKIIAETAKKVKSETLLVDLTSIKTETTKALEQIKNPAISLHFLFGPSVSTIQNQKVVIIPIRKSKLSKDLIKLLKKAGAQIIEMSTRDHDYQ